MREEVHERLRKKTDQEQFDQDKFDFLSSDPRIVCQDNEQKQKDALKNKLSIHNRYQVKESLWKNKLSESENHRQLMNRKKLELDGVHRDEKEFLNKLKEKLSTRYDKLK